MYYHIVTLNPLKANLKISPKWNFSPPRSHPLFTKITFQYFSIKHPKTQEIFKAPPFGPKVLSHSHIPTTLRQLYKCSQNWNFSPPGNHSFFTKITFQYFSLKHPQTQKIVIPAPSGPKVLSHSHIQTTLRELWKYPQKLKSLPTPRSFIFHPNHFQYFSLKQPKTQKIPLAPPLGLKVLKHSHIPTTLRPFLKVVLHFSQKSLSILLSKTPKNPKRSPQLDNQDPKHYHIVTFPQP